MLFRPLPLATLTMFSTSSRAAISSAASFARSFSASSSVTSGLALLDFPRSARILAALDTFRELEASMSTPPLLSAPTAYSAVDGRGNVSSVALWGLQGPDGGRSLLAIGETGTSFVADVVFGAAVLGAVSVFGAVPCSSSRRCANRCCSMNAMPAAVRAVYSRCSPPPPFGTKSDFSDVLGAGGGGGRSSAASGASCPCACDTFLLIVGVAGAGGSAVDDVVGASESLAPGGGDGAGGGRSSVFPSTCSFFSPSESSEARSGLRMRLGAAISSFLGSMATFLIPSLALISDISAMPPVAMPGTTCFGALCSESSSPASSTSLVAVTGSSAPEDSDSAASVACASPVRFSDDG
eukprot:m.938795 g.938795  ORF g.938795 m.938795 type:complete len:353 (-) comp23821_c1_seq2:2-1060(-)